MRSTGVWNRAWLVAIVLLGVVTVAYYGHHTPPADLLLDLQAFPAVVGPWRGVALPPSDVPLRARGADEEVSRLYEDAAGRGVTLYIGYFRSQEQGRELIGLGSAELHRRAEETAVPLVDGRAQWVNRTVLTRRDERHVVLFWYELGGRSVTGRYRGKVIGAQQALLRLRSNGALVAVSAPLATAEPSDKEVKATADFVRVLSPLVREHLVAGGARGA